MDRKKPAKRIALIPAGQEHILAQEGGKKHWVQVVMNAPGLRPLLFGARRVSRVEITKALAFGRPGLSTTWLLHRTAASVST